MRISLYAAVSLFAIAALKTSSALSLQAVDMSSTSSDTLVQSDSLNLSQSERHGSARQDVRELETTKAAATVDAIRKGVRAL